MPALLASVDVGQSHRTIGVVNCRVTEVDIARQNLDLEFDAKGVLPVKTGVRFYNQVNMDLFPE
jgi:hypothetical protein